MKVLYSRMARGRKREYQIITKIVLTDGNKYVLKEAACVQARQHLQNTFHNEFRIEPVYGDYLLHGQWTEERLLTPFIEGETLGSRLRKYLKEQDGEEKVKALLRQWRQLIIGRPENICRFVPTKEFETVFGDGCGLAGTEATSISNFDCSAENIFFLLDGGIKIIDYEWVFSFAVPIEMSFYRVLKTFYQSNQGLTEWEKLLEMAEIEKNLCHKYDQMIDAFAEYTSLDREKDIDYALMGKKFKTGKILEGKKEVFEYRFPYDLIPEGKAVILYGAGHVGEDYYNLIRRTDYCQLAVWTDKSASLYRKQGLPVSDIEEIMRCTYDYVLIAVYQEKVAEEIRKELEIFGVRPDKIVWQRPRLI